MSWLPTIAGIGWNPQIRGYLTVAVGVAVLCGSVYMLLATNLANRLGFLVAASGLFGWIFLMGITWWIYGIGMHGAAPSWQVEEVNVGDISQAVLQDARGIDTSDLPPPGDLRELTPKEFEDVAEEEAPKLDGWSLLPESDPARGEAQAAVDAELTSGRYQSLGIEATSDYLPQYAFEIGGKPERKSDSPFDRIANKITNTLRVKSPEHFAIVQVQPTVDTTTQPGQAPPVPQVDRSRPVISVVLLRDLGDRRFPAAMITLSAGLIFGLLCWLLHVRDRVVAEHRAAPLPAPTRA